jgi:hypothetical protein
MTTANNHETPWRYEPSAHALPTIVDARGNLICIMGSSDAAVARRIVAAVNSISKISVIKLSERIGASRAPVLRCRGRSGTQRELIS